jgi:eukaryotic-like serine/threonine-protein kinase
MTDGLELGSGSDATPGRRIDRLCDRFESEWEAGRRTRIEDALTELPESDRPAAFEYLLRLELDLRWVDGEWPEPREYHDRFPDHAGLIDAVFSEVAPPSTAWEADGPERGVGEKTAVGKRFRILRHHASGGMGEVSVARDEELKRDVALKEIRPEYADDGSARVRFLQEAEITGRLEHPNIIPVYGLGVHDDGRPFYTMRLITGYESSLADAVRGLHQGLAGDGNLTQWSQNLRKLLWRFIGICNAIDYAHSRGIIHRDLKPRNIMIGPFGETLVADWGFAKPIGQLDDPTEEGQGRIRPSSGSGLEPTQAGEALGTPAYMSPEQASGRHDRIGPTTDIYGLGATLYCVLTGKAPFEGAPRDGGRSGDRSTDADLRSLLDRVKRGLFPRPQTVRPEVPRILEAICLKAMALEPEGRYATARALAEDVERWLADQPVSACRDPITERARRWASRNRTAVAGVVVALVVGVIGLAAVGILQAVSNRRLRDANAATNAAKDRTEEALADSAASRRRVMAMLSDLSFERGRAFAEAGDPRGLLWMSRALENAPDHDRSRQVAIRLNLDAWRHHLIRLETFIPTIHGSISPDGRTFLVLIDDNTVQLRKTSDNTPIGKPFVHQAKLEWAHFSPDGNTVITIDAAHTSQLWRTADGKAIGKPLANPEGFWYFVFSDNSKLVLGSGEHDAGERTARLWSTADGSPVGGPFAYRGRTWNVRDPSGIGDDIHGAAIRPDGKVIVTQSGDNIMQLWSVADGSPVGRPMVHGSKVFGVRFSPDSKTLVTGASNYAAQLWNADDGMPIGQGIDHSSAAVESRLLVKVAFSPDGKFLLTGGGDHAARMWRTDDGSPAGKAMIHKDSISGLGFSPDGGKILVSCFNNGAQLWDTTTCERVGKPMVDKVSVGCVTFSPDGKLVLTGSDDGTARLWNAADGSPVGGPMVHDESVRAAAFSPDGKTIITHQGGRSTHDRTAVRIWRAADGSRIGAPFSHGNAIRWVLFSPDGKTLVTASWEGMRLWRVSDGVSIGAITGHQDGIVTTTFSPGGKMILTGSSDGTARLWSTVDGSPIGRPMHCVQTSEFGYLGATFSPDEKVIITTITETEARSWSAVDGSPVGKVMTHAGPINVTAFSPDGKLVLTGSDDGTARLWNAADGSPVGGPMVHDESVRAAAFSPDGKTIITVDKGAVRIWRAADGSRVGEPLGEPLVDASFCEGRFSPDGKLFLTRTQEMAQLWSAIDGSRVGMPMRHEGYIGPTFSPDGKFVLTSGGMIGRLWSSVDGSAVGKPLAHDGRYLEQGVFSPDGKLILTHGDNSVRLWSAIDGSAVGKPMIGPDVRISMVAFSPDGKNLVAGDDEGTARLWRVPVALEQDSKLIALWTQVITGMKLNEEDDSITQLDLQKWQDSRRRLEELGGPPSP